MTEVFIFVATAVLGGLVWGIRLEGRVSNGESRQDDFKELMNTKIDLMNEAVCARLERIERSLNGNLKHGHD
jgi:NADH:ubiquinone oxidoreductase subunit F (NADH-binding)